jgi:hypothetical protein
MRDQGFRTCREQAIAFRKKRIRSIYRDQATSISFYGFVCRNRRDPAGAQVCRSLNHANSITAGRFPSMDTLSCSCSPRSPWQVQALSGVSQIWAFVKGGGMYEFQIRRVVRLHEKATRHSENYKKLSEDLSAQTRALNHLRKAERFYSQISAIIRDINSAQA